MTKMANIPICGEILKNLVLQNPKSDDLETWHVVFGTQKLYKVSIDKDPVLTLTYVMTKSNSVTFGLVTKSFN